MTRLQQTLRKVPRGKRIPYLKHLFKRQECFILSCGPSLREYTPEELKKKLKGKIVIAIKQAYNYCPSIVTFHLINQCNYQNYQYPPGNIPVRIFCGRSKEKMKIDLSEKLLKQAEESEIIIHIEERVSIASQLTRLNNYNKYLFSNQLARPWGPGIFHEVGIYLVCQLGCSKISTLGLDLSSSSESSYTHFDEESRLKSLNFAKNTMTDENILNEIKQVAESTQYLYQWLKSKNIEWVVLSKKSALHSSIPRGDLC